MWEWRAFARRFEAPQAGLGEAAVEEREDIYLLAEGLDAGWNLKLRGGERFEAKRRRAREGEHEDWEKLLSEPLPVPPWHTRELCRALSPGGRVPVRPLRSLGDLLRLLPDTGLGAARAVAVKKRLRRAALAETLVEHAALEVAGEAWESLALSAATPAALRDARDALRLPDDARALGYTAFLLGEA